MPNNDRTTCLLKIDQCLLATDKITVYLADILDILKDNEKRFQRSHQDLKNDIEICVEIVLQLEHALNLLRQQF